MTGIGSGLCDVRNDRSEAGIQREMSVRDEELRRPMASAKKFGMRQWPWDFQWPGLWPPIPGVHLGHQCDLHMSMERSSHELRGYWYLTSQCTVIVHYVRDLLPITKPDGIY